MIKLFSISKVSKYFISWWYLFLAEAKKIGKGCKVLDEIFKYCYELGKNDSDKSALNEIANKFGINNWNN